MSVDRSKSPYFDDYNPDDKYYQVLYLPKRPVQIRELNQMQTMLQEQVKRFGNHVFTEGSMVVPGETSYDLNLNYVKVVINDLESVQNLASSNTIKLISGTGVTALSKIFVGPEGADPATFYVEYGSASNDGVTTKFVDDEVINIEINGTVVTTATIQSTGIGSKFTINSGVYYINGRFVLVDSETVLLDKYSNTPSKVVAIVHDEVAITENDDGKLYDNAQGTYNLGAPGAHRLRVNTSLKVYDLADLNILPENAVEIFRISNGLVQKLFRGPNYNILGDVLAQRTYEESGNYTVKSFNIAFSEYGDVFDTEDEDKFAVQLDPGIAYVRGYRVETLSRTLIENDKARDTGVINNSSISGALGYYITVEDMYNVPEVSVLQKISFYDAEVVTPGVVPSGSVLGTARVRFVRKDGSNYRLYLFDIRDATGKTTTSFIPDAISVYSSIGATFSANLVDAEIVDALNNSLVFPINVSYVKSLYDEFGASDTSYSSVKQVTGVLDSNGQVTFSALVNENFVAQSVDYAMGVYTDDDTFLDVVNNYALGGSPTGSVITLDFGVGNAGRPVRVNLQVAKEEVNQKTKTIQTTSKAGSLTSGQLALGKADAFEVTSIIDNDSNDVTDLFTLVPNKTKSFYGVSYVETTATVAEPITVNFKYFSHSAGDFFGPDSYVDLTYDEIPSEDGVRLTDVLDFRPRIGDNGQDFNSSGASVGNIPTPFTIVRSDVEHYLPRIDKVYVNAQGEFGVAQGVPSLNPKAPSDPSDSMILYELRLPAYTFSIGDVRAKKVKNRRYTMRDIGLLENRISNVEYYVSLNLLEQEIEAKQIIDPQTGLNRFKNGFLTDSFIDHSVGDYTWEGYRVSVSSSQAMLRPEFSLNAVDLEKNDVSSSNVVENDGLVTLPYTHESYLNQNMRSEVMNVNPYAVFRWEAEVILNPSIDSWIDTEYLDPQVTYEVFNNGELTQTWESWELNWTGGETSTSSSELLSVSSNEFSETTRDGRATTVTSGIETTATSLTTVTTVNTNVDVVNDRLIDTSVIPFMRSIEVTVNGKGCRPESKMHFFFDGINVNNYLRPPGGNYGDDVFTDIKGEFVATFKVPNDSSLSFRVGTKRFVATDQPENKRELSTSYGETTFTSSGIRNIRQQTIIATRNIDINTSVVTSNDRKILEQRTTWTDPLAQSFLVEREGGVFITKIKTFFKTKDDRVPISLQIREMENGYPTQRIVPGGNKMLHPDDVSISDDGSLGTEFVFRHPVYLMDGNEYCFVLMSNSNNYHAWIARMGQKDLGTGKHIVQQPYNGVMFKSQNNSTWTADQTADLQFEIFKAAFDTNVTGTLILENKDFPAIRLGLNPIDTTNGSSDIVINRAKHNYCVGTTVTIAGALGGNGFTADALNASHVVTEVISPNQFKVTIADETANATGHIGGNVIDISNTVQASLMRPNFATIELPKTNLRIQAKGTTGKSIDGTETPYQSMTNYIDITNNKDNNLVNPWLITNDIDETANLSGNKSLTYQLILSSDNPNVSPVIDMQGLNVITPFVLITDPATDEYDGSNNWANYRTLIAGLKTPANAIKVFLDTYRPQSSDVIVSARFGNSVEEVKSADWVQVTPIITQSSGDVVERFYENEFGLDDISSYTQYQIMIQFKSPSSTKYPIAKRLRCICLGT